MSLCIYYCLLSLAILGTEGSRILMLSVFGSTSTMMNLENLAQQLSERGHEIVYVTRERTVDKTVKNVSYILLPWESEKGDIEYQKMAYEKHFLNEFPFDWFFFLSWLAELCDGYYEEPKIINLMKEKNLFDVVIFDFLLQDCFLPFVHSLNAPIIFLHGNSLDNVIASSNNIPTPYSYVKTIFYQPTLPMSFWDRIFNFIVHLEIKFIQEYVYYPKIENIARRQLSNSPNIVDIFRNVSIIMATQDNVWIDSRPLTPFVVDIGGMHCRKALPVSPELDDVISESGENGFILFSMGTFLKPEFFPPNYLPAFLKSFSKLKQIVIWKNDKHVENLPPNVKTYKWLPQQDLLGHPKIRLFITHGGMYSLYEAIYHAVPVLGIGIYGDQIENLRHAKEKGIAVSVEKQSMLEETILKGINTMLSNSSYKTNIQKLSDVFRNQPESPLERAIFWTEFVIRHKDVGFLHDGSKEFNFIQSFSLIEFSLLSLCIFFTLTLPCLTIKLIFRNCLILF